ncbi:fatty-acid--CoA ligase [Mycobacterium antarcticum]|uniref:AMP-dependent synthetase/ligase n=1 Tax=Mycolicibacterium sp. TUM20985 TaxID=3023370 RepID=UPI00257489E5|nr:AMP-dependent synthetase/ligase [Mycolicibacterium sp. TUM20985]BDX33661.1 fatty-acid--CoA ligase [Mycolicibacterium sp. TUM20985]
MTLPAPAGDTGTLVDLFLRNVDTIPEQPALTDAGTTLTWRQYGETARALAAGLAELGVRQGSVVGMQMANRYEHLVSDTAALLAGAIGVSVYNTLSDEQAAYVAGDCGMQVVITDQLHLPTWQSIRQALPRLEHVIVLDGAADADVLSFTDVLARGREHTVGGQAFSPAAITSDHPATIVYTSGTTGNPKGVILTHRGIRFTADWLSAAFGRQLAEKEAASAGAPEDDDPLGPGSRMVSYLPLAHVAERFQSHYLAWAWGSHVHFVPEMDSLPMGLIEARPTFLLGVPRVWEKMVNAMAARLAAATGQPAALGRAALHALPNTAMLRAAIGLDRCRIAVCGAAPVDEDLLETLNAIGIPLIEIYGMTESTGLITLSSLAAPRPGAVGTTCHREVEMRIADDGEILARGPNITPGYWGRPEATAEAVDRDGWLHTGDLGRIDDNGDLRVVGRKKELIITSAGKNITPTVVENSIKRESALIGHVVAVGDQRNYLVALVVLDSDGVAAWAEHRELAASDFAYLAGHPDLLAEIDAAVTAGNQRVSRVEQIKHYRVLDHAWAPGTTELTPTLKLRRNLIAENYKSLIDELYQPVARAGSRTQQSTTRRVIA